jgi:WS/DGAT/MGAT family acyltransferase
MAKQREITFTDRMSEHEALMWNIEKDPWLNPSGSALTILDGPIDIERFRRQVRYGVANVPRLYQRVVQGLGRISTPAWVPDPEFDFDSHILQLELPAPGSERQLFDLAAKLAAEPLDRTRPLWRFVVIGGVEGGRSAIWSVFHHVISDGVGQMRMAELYQQLSRDDPGHPEVDLEEIVQQASRDHRAKEHGGNQATGLLATTAGSLRHLGRRQVGLSRRMLGEVMLWPADFERVSAKAENVLSAAKNAVDQVTGSSNERPGGSELWKRRSRHRRLEWVRVPLDGLKSAAKARGVSINDAFMAGLTEGSIAYHAKRDVEVDAFNTSLVVSTRSDNKIGGNSFTPVIVQVSGMPMSVQDRFNDLHTATEHARSVAASGGGMGGIAGIANLLPTSVVTKAARDRAAQIDFATSNLRGAPFPLYCAGGKVEASICMGPVAGTAANITAMSYDGHFDMGFMIDPVAIDDAEDYRNCVAAAFDRLLTADEPVKSKKSKRGKK